MRVLVTGGYGCIGAWIARQLLARGDDVFIYDLKEDPRRLHLLLSPEDVARVRYVAGDVTDLPGFRTALEKNQITHVVHLAGLQVPTCRADPILGAKVNVIGSLVIFEAVKALREQVQRLVYASSAAVFGPPELYPSGPLGDDVQLTPSTHYGYYKCCNEGNARIYYLDNGLSSIGLRPWAIYGVGRDLGMTSEPTKAIFAVAMGKPYHVTYGGWQDLQYVEDVANVFVRSLEVPYQGAKSYNLRGAVVDLPTFHRALIEAAPEAAKLITHGEKQLTIAYDLDDSALQKDIGPVPVTPLVEGIRQTLTRFRDLAREGRLELTGLV